MRLYTLVCVGTNWKPRLFWGFFSHEGSFNLSISTITGLIDYNFLCFRQAIQEVFDLRRKGQLAEDQNEIMVNGMLDHPVV